jgi:hypothetical protein
MLTMSQRFNDDFGELSVELLKSLTFLSNLAAYSHRRLLNRRPW